MPESENRAPQSVYDREAEFPHDETRSGRRRRPVADWGGDELFTRMPRRRSGHLVGQRRFARSDAVVAGAPPDLDVHAENTAAPANDEPRESRDDWGVGRREAHQRHHDWDLDVLDALDAGEHEAAGTPTPPEGGAEAPEPAPGSDDAGGPSAAQAPAPAPPRPAGGVPGRRTVVIGRSGHSGHPHPDAPFASVSRRRPPPTVAERIGGRPEQLVGWAFALGLILILIAIATAHA